VRTSKLPSKVIKLPSVQIDPDITRLLQVWTGGDRAALDALMPSVADDMKRIAQAYLTSEPKARTLQTTALVNEAYLRLVKVRPQSWTNRGQFFALTAQIMRRILVDHARSRLAECRGGAAMILSTDEVGAEELAGTRSLTAFHDALLDLEKLDARKSKIVELRIFGGLTNAEVAEALDTSERTVIREWQFARAWLSRQLNYSVGEID
jgi:RNA polymerase sigma-70 factor, ECF subfamily